MADSPVIYNVRVADDGVKLRRLEPGRKGYKRASAKVVLRERDAIKLYQSSQVEAEAAPVYSFRSLDHAKTFAMLMLKAREREIENNLDRIQAYDGSRASSG